VLLIVNSYSGLVRVEGCYLLSTANSEIGLEQAFSYRQAWQLD